MKVYIAGPMRGYDKYNCSAFNVASLHMLAEDHEVVNPHTLDVLRGFVVDNCPDDYDWDQFPPEFDPKQVIKENADALLDCDAIYLLKDWEYSVGCRHEKAMAEMAGLEVVYQTEPGDNEITCPLCEEGIDVPSEVEDIDAWLEQEGMIGEAEPADDAATARKQQPVATGVLDYFPNAMKAIAHCSWVGNEQHNPGESLHWSKEKSSDHADCLIRHFLDRGTIDTDGVGHTTKVAWRALALLETELENALGSSDGK